jgi:ABC-2 type transport system ATP-binding protein
MTISQGRAAIEARDLHKTYAGKVAALNGVSFDVPRGTVFGLLGPNGAGKSTTVRILTTLSSADSGAARVAGFDVARDPGRVRRSIGVVGQASGVDPNATGRENLLLQGRLFGMRAHALRERVTELLTMLGLTEAADRLVSTYSGGMARRLDIALGLIHRPQVLFLDEPTTGLDPEVRAAIWDEIARLAHDEGLTILLTTHYLEEADRLAANLAIIDRGQVVAQGTPDGLKAELHGDALTIELREPTGRAPIDAALAGISGIEDVRLEGRTVLLRVAAGASALPVVLSALEGAGVAVAAATVARPSLDDVYLRYAGRSFAAADATTAEEASR